MLCGSTRPCSGHGHVTPAGASGAGSNVSTALPPPLEEGVRADQAAGLSPTAVCENHAARQAWENAAFLTRHPVNTSGESPRVLPAKAEFRGREWTCSHYARECWFRADCCDGSYVACRICHDEECDHELDRFAVSHVACRTCGAKDVPIGKTCSACGAEFARYYCDECHLMENDAEKAAEIYHCKDCRICRRGKGLGIDNHHCNRCGCCVPIEVKDSHPCRPRALDSTCPVCMDELSHSVEQVVFMRCGHAIHEPCFRDYTKTKYTCPICFKCFTDMSNWYKALDEYLEKERKEHPLSREMAARRSEVYCNDCEKKSITPWHYQHHKCQPCGSYNTSVISSSCADISEQERT